MKKDLIKRTLTIITLVLCVVCNAGAETTTEEIPLYLGMSTLSTSGSINLSTELPKVGYNIENVATKLNKSKDDLLKNYYIRWYLKLNNKIINISTQYNNGNWLLDALSYNNFQPFGLENEYKNAYSDNIGRYYCSNGAAKVNWLASNNKAENPILPDKLYYNNLSETDASKYELVCEITDDFNVNNIPSTSTASETTLPTFKLRYIFHFGTKPNNFTYKDGAKTTISKSALLINDKDKVGVSGVTLNNNLTTATINLDESTDLANIISSIKYVRWYFVNDKGEAIEKPSGINEFKLPESLTWNEHANFPEDGKYWTSETASTDAIKDITLTANSVDDLVNTHLVCVMSSTNYTGDGTTQEPAWDVKYALNFEKPFRGELAENAIQKEFTFSLAESQWSSITTANIAFDFTDNKITLKDQSNKEYGSVAYADMADKKKDSNLCPTELARKNNNSTPAEFFYVRWFLRTAGTTTEVAKPDVLTSADNNSNEYNTVEGRGIYFLSSKAEATKSYCDLKSNNVLAVKLNKSNIDLCDYDLVATVYRGSEDVPLENGELTKEPDVLTGEYVFHFNKRGFEAENLTTNEPEVTVIERTAYLGTDGNVYCHFYDDEHESVEKILTNINKTKYVRLSIQKKQENNTYKNINSTDGNYTFSEASSWKINENYGYYNCNGDQLWNNASGLNIGYTTNNSNKSLKFNAENFYEGFNDGDYRIVFYLTDDISDKVGESYNLACEPTIKMMYVYSLKKRDFVAENISDLTVENGEVIERKAYVAADGTVGINFYTAENYNVSSKLSNLGNSLYIRIAVTDKDGNIVYNDGTTTYYTITGDLWSQNTYGNYCYSTSIWTAANLNKIIKLDKTNISNVSDYKIIFYLTDDLSDYITYDKKLIYEPSIKLQYVYSLEEENLNRPFKHYKGYAYNDDTSIEETWELKTKGSDGKMKYQDTHEWEYDLYVPNTEGKEVKLTLPFGTQSFGENKAFDVLEPSGYLRWYDYNTDAWTDEMVLAEGTSLTKSDMGAYIHYGTGSNMHYDKDGQVTFKVPSNWDGESDIACDVSRYIDFETSVDGTKIFHEPTLQIRYIFHVHQATDIANDLMNALINSNGVTPLEYQGYTTLGVTNEGKGTANLRVDLQEEDDYYFYDYNYSNKSIPSTVTISEKNFGKELIQSKAIKWYAYDISGKYYIELGTGRMQEIGLSTFQNINSTTGEDQGVDFKSFSDNSTTKLKFSLGDVVYVSAYAIDNEWNPTKFCPVSEYIVRFLGNCYPIKYDDITESQNNTRYFKWLRENYTEIKNGLTFDEDSKGVNLKAPTNPIDNMTALPSKWANRHYGFNYARLYDYINPSNLSGNYGGLGCLHGEYGLFKSANVDGISKRGTNTYNGKNYVYGWYNSNTLYDRTYYMKGQYGYFLYVDASVEARPVCSASFDATLCAGNSLVFTAAVADMTEATSKTSPQLMFRLYGAKETSEGSNEWEKNKLIHSFCTGDLSTEITGYALGTWYQVYAKVTLQKNTGVENYNHFILELDNYGANTEGNDYAVDDIHIYQSNTNILATQDAPMCSTDKYGEVTFKIRHESIVAKFGVVEQWATKKLRWQVRNKKDGSVVTGVKGYVTGKDYGEVTVYRNSSNIAGSMIPEEDKKDGGLYPTINGEIYIVLAENAELLPGDYYISASMQSGTGNADVATDNSFDTWGAPEATCTVYSDYFTIGQQQLSVTTSNTTSNSSIVKDCSTGNLKTVTTDDKGNTTTSDNATISASMTVPDPINGGTIKVSNALYDWYVGTNTEFTSAKYNETDLDDALAAFRNAYPTATDYNQTTTTNGYTEAYKAVLKNFVDNGTLFLGKSSITLTKLTTSTKTQYFYLKPLVQDVEISYTNSKGESATQMVTICTDGQELSLSVTTNGPTLNLGFADVTYPTSAGNRAVRLGLDHHINKMSGTTGTQLRLPVHDYTHKVTPSSGVFNLVAGDGTNDDTKVLYVNDSNDPTWTETLKKQTVTAATIDGIDAHYVYIKFDKTLTSDLAFHEGYWYDVDFTIHDSGETHTSGQSYCIGEVFFRLKVVPEYVTWTGKADENYGSTNWNNDENWTRSLTTEIYKDATNYTDYEKEATAGKLSQQKTYVPMKFTKVTVPLMSNFKYAYLAKMETKDNGILKDGCLTNADSYAATDYIQYDIMVKMKADTEDENNSGTTPSTEAFGCEKFYGNTCAEIYFKPEAELRQQQYLDYETAWVEKELESNKWYTLTSPLQDTYAGDMYVPKASGRQETEAFSAITFNTDTYSRNIAPIYQRSWDRSDSKAIMNDNGTIKKDAADISYNDWESEANATNLLTSNWGHVYNDMSVKYYDESETTPRYGFALKAGNDTKDVGSDVNSKTIAMIRLPKADTKYDYYYANDKTDAGESKNVSVSKDAYGKLLMDKDNIYKADENEYGSITQSLVNSSTTSGNANGIYMVSNPYMKTLNMVKFFNMNPNLEPKFWIVRGGEVKAAKISEVTQTSSDGSTASDLYMPSIKPLESFFVKVASGKTATSVVFNTNITTSTNYLYGVADENSSTTATKSAPKYKSRSGMTVVSQPELVMTAQNNAGRSTASVEINENADNDFVDSEDVETLYDSNLTSLPTLYTVAGSEAVSINTLSDIDMLPIGIVSSTTDNATVKISGLSTLASDLYLYDATNKTSVELSDSAMVTLAANAHGRYFLTTRSTIPSFNDDEKVANDIKVYSPTIHTLVVSSLGSTITCVKVFTTDGRIIAEESVNDSTVTLTTISGVNVVVVETEAGTKTIKVNVR